MIYLLKLTKRTFGCVGKSVSCCGRAAAGISLAMSSTPQAGIQIYNFRHQVEVCSASPKAPHVNISRI
jgi:hypothetical protein